jgi:hypothetical protein
MVGNISVPATFWLRSARLLTAFHHRVYWRTDVILRFICLLSIFGHAVALDGPLGLPGPLGLGQASSFCEIANSMLSTVINSIQHTYDCMQRHSQTPRPSPPRQPLATTPQSPTTLPITTTTETTATTTQTPALQSQPQPCHASPSLNAQKRLRMGLLSER